MKKAATAREILTSAQQRGALLVLCEDQIRTERALEHFFSKTDLQAAKRFSCKNLSKKNLAEMELETQSPGLFQAKQCFIFSGTDNLKADQLEKLLELAKTANENFLMAFTAQKLNARSKFRKFFQEENALLEISPLEAVGFLAWLKKELQSHKIKAKSQQVLEQLARISDDSPDEAHAAIEQIALFLDGEKTLTSAHLEALFTAHVAQNEYDFLDEILDGKAPQAQASLLRLLRSGKNHFLVLSLLRRNFLQLLALAEGLRGGHSVSKIQERFGIHPFAAKKLSRYAKKHSPAIFMRKLSKISETEFELKDRNLGPELTIGKLVDHLSRS